MNRKLIIIFIIACLVAVPIKAFGEGYFSVGVGVGGEADAANLTMELDSIDNRLIAFGLSIMFNADSMPSGTLEYSCPHNDYTDLGKRQKENEFAFFGKYGIEVIADGDLFFFATGGISLSEEIHLVRSNITGWYYEQSSDENYKILIGSGLNYLLPNNKNFISIEYDNIRGATASVGFQF